MKHFNFNRLLKTGLISMIALFLMLPIYAQKAKQQKELYSEQAAKMVT